MSGGDFEIPDNSGEFAPRRPSQKIQPAQPSIIRTTGQRHQNAVLDASADALPVAVIDGPYDTKALSGILARAPADLGSGRWSIRPSGACDHGTFIMGLLGARANAGIPGLCPDCRLFHIPLFVDEGASWASVADLANSIIMAVAAGAKLINLSLAILGDDGRHDRKLSAALDEAEASGAVVMVAAGNQGHLAAGQLLSHPATIPVAAVDAFGRPLPDCNFGPWIAQRGVSAFGDKVEGYAPGGGTTLMSGTSAATAIATGTLARLWSACPDIDGADIRAAVARLVPRNGRTPPMLRRNTLIKALNQKDAAMRVPCQDSGTSFACLQGATAMNVREGLSRSSDQAVGPISIPRQAVALAHGSAGCACGAPGGVCTCENGGQRSFVYVLGTVDIRFPDQSISAELQTVAETMGVQDDPNLRIWYHRVLSLPEARHVARLVSWVLTVEGQFAYYLVLRDWHDLDDLVRCLGEPKDEDLCLVVGSSSLVPVETCAGVVAPVLAVDQISLFKMAELTEWGKKTPAPLLQPPVEPLEKRHTEKKRRGSHEPDPPNPPDPPDPGGPDPTKLFNMLVQSADNFGDTDAWRALNYLAVRYPAIYETYAELSDTCELVSVKVMVSRLAREKHIVDPVFAFQNRDTGVVTKFFVRMDVTHLFPMIANPIAEYFDR